MNIIRLATILILSASCMARAADFVEHSHADIRKDVQNFILKEASKLDLEDIRVAVGNLDYRLKVHKCLKPIDYALPPYTKFSSKVTVEVACNDNEPWKLYIQSQITAYQKVVVTRNPVLRKQVLSSSDISLEKREVSSLNSGFFSQTEQVTGRISRLNLPAGAVIVPRNIMIPKVVKRGDQVIILAETSGIQVRMSGKAMNDAALGERVRVMNGKSRRIVEGNAIEKGIVKIKM